MKDIPLRIFAIGFAICCAWLTLSAAVAAGPAGASPDDPLMVPTGSLTLAPETTLWFYFDYGVEHPGLGPGGMPSPFGKSDGQSRVSVAVDANSAEGLRFAIYTPAQATDWLRDQKTEPVGRGTPFRETSSSPVTHDLFWSGGFNATGRYRIAVTNESRAPVSFRMSVTGEQVTLYPTAVPSPTATLDAPITVTPVPTATVQGKILFEDSTGGNIYTVNGDGTGLTRVSHGIDPAWSYDGRQITFVRWDNTAPGVYVASADGSSERLVFTAPRVRWPRWSPDGKSIVFAQDKSKDDAHTTWKLGIVEVATGRLTEPQCSQLCYVPSWSKDGTHVVYTDPSIGILTTNVSQGPALRVGPTGSYYDSSANLARPITTWPPIQNSAMSPDGTRIIYAMQTHDRWEVYVMSASGGAGTAVTRPDELYDWTGVPVHNVAPTWSPDGREILYLSDHNGKWEFLVCNADGSNVRQVLKNVTDQISVNFGYENERLADWTGTTAAAP